MVGQVSADVLRQAATILREQAEAATPGPWHWSPPSAAEWPSGDESLLGAADETVLYGWGYDASGIEATDADRTYIATMHPGVGLALADLLNNLQGAQPNDVDAIERDALTLARLIVGEPDA